MHPRYPRVFSPIRLGPVEIKNRFYASPHICPHTTSGGAPSEDFVAYFAERVKGGCGLVISSMSVPARGRGVLPTPHLKENIPAIRALADAIHRAGGKYIVELWYHWARPGVWGAFSPPAPILAPSAVQFNLFEKRAATREMSKGEIRAMVEAFRQSTENLREAGVDGIMHHASHGAILEQFLSPYFNRRTDEYGGSLDNRMRLLIETLEQTRAAAGEHLAVGMRMNCDELLQGGYDTKQSYEILKRIADMGLLDFVDLDVAVEPDQFHIGMPSVFIEPHVYKPYVETIRKAAGKVPVLSVLGRLTSIADGEAAIAAGICDMVGAARALIAEPHLVKNAYEGNEHRSRTCIACNWCMAAMYDGAQTCTINPVAWRERTWGTIPPAPKRAKVVVIGAGPAGLEAARVSALRGHEVVLFEARDRLGGALALWASLPGREFYMKSIEWWEREVRELGIDIRLNTTATAAAVLSETPDAVIVATGARYSRAGHSNHRDFPIPGYDQDFVFRPEDILHGNARPSGKVVILDAEGLHSGVGIAELLAKQGANVEYLTPYFSPVSPRVEARLEVTPLMKRLRAAGVKISPTSYIGHIGRHEVTVYDVYSEEERTIKGVDAVVLSTGRVSVNEIERELDGKVEQLFAIGDALSARMWATASYEGHKFARYIGEPDAPRTVGELYFETDLSR
jgi:2,4-dienoyl-CoA reductase-like NADH-dependent reductase (Old Yellow Enzyme family)